MSPPDVRRLALCALLAAACGGLETPVVTVTGRIVGAAPGAYAYPLGRPDLKVALGAGGEFRIEGVPTSATGIVLFDGEQVAGRAELTGLALRGGEEHRVADRYGSAAEVAEGLKMPLAGRIVVAALPDGGAVPSRLTFTVLETDHEDRPTDAGDQYAATLYPLPAGSFDVEGAEPGFKRRIAPVKVAAGATVSLQLVLDVDASLAAPGCASSGGCKDDLHCKAIDGRCYECTSDDHCEGGERCDGTTGLCAPISGPATEVCASCRVDADCDPASALVCVAGYCAPLCSAGCPSGFLCNTEGRCKARNGCGDWFRIMGATCVSDGPCVDDLQGGVCLMTSGTSGYCTAPCTQDADCRIGTATALFTCVGAPAGFCAPGP